MSYTLAVWYSSKKITSKDAETIYRRLLHADASLIEEGKDVEKFYDAIIFKHTRLEELTNKQAEHSIWSESPARYRKHVILFLNHPPTTELLEDIKNLAISFGMVCYDPQQYTLFSSTGISSHAKTNWIVRIVTIAIVTILFGVIRSWFR